VLVGVGLIVTNQLSKKMAVFAAVLLATVTTVARIGLVYAMA
jgi:hypothetical protein